MRALPRRERLFTRPSLAELFSDVRSKKMRNHQIDAAIHNHEHALQKVADFVSLRPSTVSMIGKRLARNVDRKMKL